MQGQDAPGPRRPAPRRETSEEKREKSDPGVELAQRGQCRWGFSARLPSVSYKPLGVSTSYPRTVALLLNPIAPEFVAENAYFQRVAPIVDWQLMLVLGIVIGGFIASRVVARRRGQAKRTGEGASQSGHGSCRGRARRRVRIRRRPAASSDTRRKWRAFLGGFLVLFGARLADGCTSGHVITGMTQLATASFLFAAAVFAVGIPAAKWLRAKGWA